MELKPCPFCGGEAELKHRPVTGSEDKGWFVRCKCSVRIGMKINGIGLAKAEAIEAWNTRAERTCRNLAEPDEVYDRPFTCSECGASGPYGEGTYHMAKTETAGKELAAALGIAEGSVIHSDAWPVWKYCPNCGAKVVCE